MRPAVPVRSTNLVIWSLFLSRPAMPTKRTLPPYFFAVLATAGPSAWHLGHHGAQNQSTTGLPARLDPSNALPSSVVPVNFSSAGTSAAGADAVALPSGEDSPIEASAEVGAGGAEPAGSSAPVPHAVKTRAAAARDRQNF